MRHGQHAERGEARRHFGRERRVEVVGPARALDRILLFERVRRDAGHREDLLIDVRPVHCAEAFGEVGFAGRVEEPVAGLEPALIDAEPLQ